MATPPSLSRVTVAVAADTYLDRVNADKIRGVLADTTAANYARDMADFVALAGADTILDDLTGQDVDDLLLRYQSTPDGRYKDPSRKTTTSGRSVLTTIRFRQSLSRFLSHASRDGWVQANPMLWASKPPKARGALRIERTALTADTATALLESLDGPAAPAAVTNAATEGTGPRKKRADHDLADRDRLILSLLVILGPRVSEVAKANIDDFTPDQGVMTWRIIGKGGKPRGVPLSGPLVDLLDDYRTKLRPTLLARAAHDDVDVRRALFISWRGRRIDEQAVRALLTRAMKHVPDDLSRAATPHALRHTAATILLANGWDVKVVSDLLGHASIATTGIYLDPIDGELATAIASHPLASALATRPGPLGTSGHHVAATPPTEAPTAP